MDLKIIKKMKSEKTIRHEIFQRVIELYHLKQNSKKFIAGKDVVCYAGRIYDEKELVNLVDASLDFWLTAGRFSEIFEKNLADFLGVRYALFTNSGSSANLLAVSALTSPLLKNKQLHPGDEVITTACGFPTGLNPIIQNNLIPVFVDIKLGTYNIDVQKIEQAVTKKTKAIFIAHTLGNPVEVDAIFRIVRKYKLWFIEDNCDALGSIYKGRRTGTFGHISTCSFYPAHHITTGEGGAVFTNDSILKKIISSFRDWGRDCCCRPGEDNSCGKRFSWKLGALPPGYDHKYTYSHIGYNLKATDMQAAIGVAQLKKLPWFIEQRRKNFAFLARYMRKYDKSFLLPLATEESKPSWFGFPIMVQKTALFTRAEIVNFLEKNKIATRMLFGGNLTKQPAYQHSRYRISSDLANTDLVMENLFWIGVYPGIDEKKMQWICKTFTRFFKERAITE